jgi:hypothetical protein
MARAGTTHIDQELQYELDALITLAYMDGIAVQSNVARSNAANVAAAASLGLLTTEDPMGNFTRTWRPTMDGLLWVRSMRDAGAL